MNTFVDPVTSLKLKISYPRVHSGDEGNFTLPKAAKQGVPLPRFALREPRSNLLRSL